MKSKAFFFSITALYFVVIFLLFLGLFLFTYHKSMYKQDISLDNKTNWKYYSNQSSDTIPTSGWCSFHLVYDPDQDNQDQSSINIQRYCENYGQQRII